MWRIAEWIVCDIHLVCLRQHVWYGHAIYRHLMPVCLPIERHEKTFNLMPVVFHAIEWMFYFCCRCLLLAKSTALLDNEYKYMALYILMCPAIRANFVWVKDCVAHVCRIDTQHIAKIWAVQWLIFYYRQICDAPGRMTLAHLFLRLQSMWKKNEDKSMSWI